MRVLSFRKEKEKCIHLMREGRKKSKIFALYQIFNPDHYYRKMGDPARQEKWGTYIKFNRKNKGIKRMLSSFPIKIVFSF